MASPCMAKSMQPLMRYMMDALMKVTEHDNDPTYKEIQDFMNPESVGKPFVDAPGTFKPGMKPRYSEVGMGMFGVKTMKMTRYGMKKAGPPHDQGITFEKFAEHRGYATPGYEPKHPKDGETAPDGKILAIDGSGTTSTLLAEAKKVAEKAGTSKVIVCFDGMTCPFYRACAPPSVEPRAPRAERRARWGVGPTGVCVRPPEQTRWRTCTPCRRACPSCTSTSARPSRATSLTQVACTWRRR